jgi:(4-alkanoyl-5-oxo-2,5-dihydrofuran-3-yl)methyl phosphate reductase
MILVTGATGNIGSEVVRSLVDEGHRVRVLSRNPEQATRFPKSVEFACGDLQQPGTLKVLLTGVEKAFLLAGAMELQGITRNFVAAARRAGVKHIVLNSSGTIGLLQKTKIGEWHLEAENKLRSSGLRWTMLRPGNFASNTARWAGMIRSQGTVFAPCNHQTVPIDPRDIGAVAAAVLGGSGHEEKTYDLTGPEAMRPSEQVACIGKAIGRPLKFVEVPMASARANMLKSGMPEILVDSILDLIEADGAETAPHITTTVQEITGRQARTFAEWSKDYAKAFA